MRPILALMLLYKTHRMRHILGFQCIACGKEHRLSAAKYTCPACAGNLQVVYDYKAVRRRLSRASLAATRDPGLWRWLAGGPPILTESIATTLLEGQFAPRLADIQAQFPDVGIGSYPFFLHGALGTKIVLRTTDTERLRLAVSAVQEMFASCGV